MTLHEMVMTRLSQRDVLVGGMPLISCRHEYCETFCEIRKDDLETHMGWVFPVDSSKCFMQRALTDMVYKEMSGMLAVEESLCANMWQGINRRSARQPRASVPDVLWQSDRLRYHDCTWHGRDEEER